MLCIVNEGKNRQVRRMFAAIEKNVCYLKRVAVGDIKLGNLRKGTYRMLTDEEVAYLKKIYFFIKNVFWQGNKGHMLNLYK